MKILKIIIIRIFNKEEAEISIAILTMTLKAVESAATMTLISMKMPFKCIGLENALWYIKM
jgi:hypothetical protein